MDEKFKTELLRIYGSRCEKHLEEIDKRFGMVIAAIIYCGNQGDTPLAQLNRFFESHCK